MSRQEDELIVRCREAIFEADIFIRRTKAALRRIHERVCSEGDCKEMIAAKKAAVDLSRVLVNFRGEGEVALDDIRRS
jgi:hypothetical protein